MGVVLLGLVAYGVYAVTAPPPAAEASPETSFEAEQPTAATQVVVVTEIVGDEADRAVADAVAASGMATFVSQSELESVLPAEVVRVLVAHGAVLEVPEGADLGMEDSP